MSNWFDRLDSPPTPARIPQQPDASLGDLMAYEEAGGAVAQALTNLEAAHAALVSQGLHPWMAKLAHQRLAASTWNAFMCQMIGNELLEIAAEISFDIPDDVVMQATACYQAAADWSKTASALGRDPDSRFSAKLPMVPFAWQSSRGRSPAYVTALVRSCQNARHHCAQLLLDTATPALPATHQQALKAIKRNLIDTDHTADRAISLGGSIAKASSKLLDEITALAHQALSGYFGVCQMLAIPAATGVSLAPQYNPAANPVRASAPPPRPVPTRPASCAPQFDPTAPAAAPATPKKQVKQFNPFDTGGAKTPPVSRVKQFDPFAND